MMPVVWPALSLTTALVEHGSGESPDLLRISLVIALVVASVVAVSFALRPLLPPTRPPISEAELDDRTLRSLEIAGEAERPLPETPRRPAEVIPFPRGPRDPILDENERLYRDPIVAARLRAVLDPGRRRLERLASASSERPGGIPITGQPAPTPVRPWRVGEHERRRVRHTEVEPSPSGARDGAGRDQEPLSMPPSDMESLPSDIPFGPIAERGSSGDRQDRGPDATRTPELIEGSPPSSADLDRLSATGHQPRSKVVPFIPRQATRDATPDETPVEPAVVDALTASDAVAWHIVEIDRVEGDMRAAVVDSYRYLVEAGLSRGRQAHGKTRRNHSVR